MKKSLLLMTTFLFGIGVNAQFTQGNAPALGDELTLYLLDSLAPDLIEVQGDGVTWDYSGVTGYGSDQTNVVSIGKADTSAYATEFPNSTFVSDIEGFFGSYMEVGTNGRTGQGFVFNGEIIELGDVIGQYSDTTSQNLYTYPFAYGDIINSDFTGNVILDLGGGPMPLPLLGKSEIAVDGRGTLKLAGNDYENVLRYKLLDTMYVLLGEDPDIDSVLIIRNQFEYYSHETSNLPIFIHTYIAFQHQEIGIDQNFAVVLSYEDPITASIKENVLASTSIYPNPAKEELNIKLPSSVTNAEVVITDALGRKMLKGELTQTNNKVDVSTLNSGTYFVQMTDNENSVVKTIVIK